MNASAWLSSVSARYCWISSGVAMRAIGPISQLERSGPRNGLVRSAAVRPRPTLPPPEEQAARDSTKAARVRAGIDLRCMAQQVQELFPYLFLVKDAAERRGDRDRARLLDPAHLDAEVPRLDHHHGAQRMQLLFKERHHLLGQALLELRPLGVE